MTNKETDHFKPWLLTKASQAWEEVIKFMGFNDVRTSYIQGYYAGYLKALEESEEEDKNNAKVFDENDDKESRR